MASAPYILLVDDDPQNLYLIAELLDLEGYRTQSADSGAAALALAQAECPALILLDVMMPDMNGFEVCDRLRQDPMLRTVPIIFLTALDDDESRLRGVEALGDDYLTKPIKTEMVLKKIQAVLRLHQLRSEASQQTLAAQHRLLQQTRDRYERQMSAVQKISETLSEKFHLFVPQQFLDRIAPRGVESIQVGNATESEMTVLFCDIRDFTKIVEFQQATETFTWLNALFEEINTAITLHNGFVDKYLGDAVMAVFDHDDTHILDGMRAAVAQDLRSHHC
jgi:adenylate cyclase